MTDGLHGIDAFKKGIMDVNLDDLQDEFFEKSGVKKDEVSIFDTNGDGKIDNDEAELLGKWYKLKNEAAKQAAQPADIGDGDTSEADGIPEDDAEVVEGQKKPIEQAATKLDPSVEPLINHVLKLINDDESVSVKDKLASIKFALEAGEVDGDNLVLPAGAGQEERFAITLEQAKDLAALVDDELIDGKFLSREQADTLYEVAAALNVSSDKIRIDDLKYDLTRNLIDGNNIKMPAWTPAGAKQYVTIPLELAQKFAEQFDLTYENGKFSDPNAKTVSEEPMTEEQAAEPEAVEPKAEEPQADKPQVAEAQADKAQADKPQAAEPQADKAQVDKAKADKTQDAEAQADKAQADKPQATEAQADKAQVDKAKADKTQNAEAQAEKDIKTIKENLAKRTDLANAYNNADNFYDLDHIIETISPDANLAKLTNVEKLQLLKDFLRNGTAKEGSFGTEAKNDKVNQISLEQAKKFAAPLDLKYDEKTGKFIEEEKPNQKWYKTEEGKAVLETVLAPFLSAQEKSQQVRLVMQHMENGYGLGESLMLVGILASQATDIASKTQEYINSGVDLITPEHLALKEGEQGTNLLKSVANTTTSGLRLVKSAGDALYGIYEGGSSLLKAEDILNDIIAKADRKTMKNLADRIAVLNSEYGDVIARDSVVVAGNDIRFPNAVRDALLLKLGEIDKTNVSEEKQKVIIAYYTDKNHAADLDSENLPESMKDYTDAEKTFAKQVKDTVNTFAKTVDDLPHEQIAQLTKDEKLTDTEKLNYSVTALVLAMYAQTDKTERLTVNQMATSKKALASAAEEAQTAIQDVTGLVANVKDNINTGIEPVDKTKDALLSPATVVKGLGEAVTLDFKKSQKTLLKAANEFTFGAFDTGAKKLSPEEQKTIIDGEQTARQEYIDKLGGNLSIAEMEDKLRQAKAELEDAESAQNEAEDNAQTDAESRKKLVLAKAHLENMEDDLRKAEDKVEAAQKKAQEKADKDKGWWGKLTSEKVDIPADSPEAKELKEAQEKVKNAKADIEKLEKTIEDNEQKLKDEHEKAQKEYDKAHPDEWFTKSVSLVDMDETKYPENQALQRKIREAKSAQTAISDAQAKVASLEKQIEAAKAAQEKYEETKSAKTEAEIKDKVTGTYKDVTKTTKDGITVRTKNDRTITTYPDGRKVYTITNGSTYIVYPNGTRVIRDVNGEEKTIVDKKVRAQYESMKNVEKTIDKIIELPANASPEDKAKRNQLIAALALSTGLKNGTIDEEYVTKHAERIRQLAENGGSAFWNWVYNAAYTNSSNAGELSFGQKMEAIGSELFTGTFKQMLRNPVEYIDATALGFLCPRTATSSALFAIGTIEITLNSIDGYNSTDRVRSQNAYKGAARGAAKLVQAGALIAFEDGAYALTNHNCWGCGHGHHVRSIDDMFIDGEDITPFIDDSPVILG